MRRSIGAVVLGLSACGYSLTQLAVRRGGVRGAALAELVCGGLAVRDASMLASGVTDRLDTVPAALLRLETAVGVVASLAGLHPLLSARPVRRTVSPGAGAADNLRRAAVAALFALHTVRFAIYLSPGQGRRMPSAEAGRQAAEPVARILSPGQHGDCPRFIPLMEAVRIARRGKGRPRTRPGAALGDKAYSSAANRAYLRKRGIKAVIPVKEDQKKHRRRRGRAGGRPPAFDAGPYKERNTVERCFAKLRQFRAVATRYDKREFMYQGTVDVASIRIWLRDPVP